MTSQITPPGPTEPRKPIPGAHNRARAARLARRAAQFNKFRLIQLNLVPLVDTFVSVVFFTLVTATVGELAPVVAGVNLPESRIGQPAMQQITLGIGPQVTLAGRPVMSTVDAAAARSDDPAQPLMIPLLYAALRAKADSIRTLRSLAAGQSIDAPLAIQGDRTMRYDLLSRVMQTARLAGFRNLTLQVNHIADAVVRSS
jgi:biopolymer transport protein ExbD